MTTTEDTALPAFEPEVPGSDIGVDADEEDEPIPADELDEDEEEEVG